MNKIDIDFLILGFDFLDHTGQFKDLSDYDAKILLKLERICYKLNKGE